MYEITVLHQQGIVNSQCPDVLLQYVSTKGYKWILRIKDTSYVWYLTGHKSLWLQWKAIYLMNNLS